MSDGHSATVAEMWRYPVKSMLGERVDAAEVNETGFAGDRGYAVIDPATGKVGSAKHPRLWGALLQCEARCYLAPPQVGAPPPPVSIKLPNGDETGSEDPRVDEQLSAVFGRPVQLTTVAPEGNGYLAVWPTMEGVIPDDVREQSAIEGSEADGTLTELSLGMASPGTFFDVSALHMLTTATLRHLGELEPDSKFAVQRYRPNVVIESTAEPFSENTWSGASLRLGAGLVALGLIPTMRCIMTTLAQGDLPRDNNVLRTVTRSNRIEIPGLGTWSCVGAYAVVTNPGAVRLGDEFTVEPAA